MKSKKVYANYTCPRKFILHEDSQIVHFGVLLYKQFDSSLDILYLEIIEQFLVVVLRRQAGVGEITRH